jgi:hypothetical protein
LKFVEYSSKQNITKPGLLLFITPQVDNVAFTGSRNASVVLTQRKVPRGLDLRLNVKVTVLWVFTSHSTCGKFQYFGGTHCLNFKGRWMLALMYLTLEHQIPEDINIYRYK